MGFRGRFRLEPPAGFDRDGPATPTQGVVMGEKGKKDKGGKEDRKKPLLSPKEKKKAKQEKKGK